MNTQVPPAYSAVRVGTKRMYDLARKGASDTIDRSNHTRTVTVSKYEAWRDESNRQELHFRVACSKGTYVRTLAYDLGHALGSAAHLTALRRESIGELTVDNAWQPKEIAQALYDEGKRFRDARRKRKAAEAALKQAAEDAAASAAAAAGDLDGSSPES